MGWKHLFLALMAFGLSGSAVAADYVYAVQDVSARRWMDHETISSGDIKTNDRLMVVFKKDGWVRVRLAKSTSFGWIPETDVTVQKPEGVTESAGVGSSLDGLSPEMQLKLQQLLNKSQPQ